MGQQVSYNYMFPEGKRLGRRRPHIYWWVPYTCAKQRWISQPKPHKCPVPMHGPTKPPLDVSPVFFLTYPCKFKRCFGKFRWYSMAHTIRGTLLYVWLILMANVGKYTIHGSDVVVNSRVNKNTWQFNQAQHTSTPKVTNLRWNLTHPDSQGFVNLGLILQV